MKKGDAEAKGVRDILFEPDIICMLLLLAEVLASINLFSNFPQTVTLIYNSLSAKLNRLLDRLARIKEELQNLDNNETDLKYFPKELSLLKLSSERNDVGRNLRDRRLVHSESPELVNKFLQNITYGFIDDLIKEIDTALTDDSPIIPPFRSNMLN